ncbi:MAG: AraC family transcriptional regulator [Pseudomonadales bacterium]|nr:AraC family transcriptional regulator [Pseudomonadales bacterium]
MPIGRNKEWQSSPIDLSFSATVNTNGVFYMAISSAADAKTASVDYVSVLLQYAEQQGIDSNTLLSDAQIDPAILATSNAYISTLQYQQLVQAAVERLQDPAMALKVGQRQHLATHGALGYAIMSSNNLEQALQLVQRFIRTRNRLIRFNFFIEGDQAVTQLEIKHPVDALYQHCVELAFSSMISICYSLTETTQQPCEIKLNYAQPDHHQAYQALLHTRPVFSAGVNELRFPMHWFEGLNLLGNASFAQLAQQQCEELLTVLLDQPSLSAQVKTLLTHSPGFMPSQEDIAKHLGLSTRSLSRQLAAQGDSFQKLLNQCREELAKQHLANNEISIEDIAYLLAYESPPNFSRAFKRWCGLTPQQYRLQNRQ